MAETLKIGIVSDGPFGDRAFENISRQFPCEWILVPYSASPIIDDVELDLPACDLIISYARHPDVILTLVEHKIPVVLGVTPGPGLVRQAKEINPEVVAPPTMCSLEPTTGCREIDLYAERFGLPGFQTIIDNGQIARMEIIREAPCGSTRGAVADCTGMPLCTGTLQHFGLRICHHCVAPRFGKTCDKEVSGALHIRQLLHSIPEEAVAAARLETFRDEMDRILEQHRKKTGWSWVTVMFKVPPHPDYPPEEGRYLRGNDFSPVAVVIILTTDPEEIPPEIEHLVRTGVESGAALSGTLQTANIGIEKIICNIVANPNIRYLILSGPESEGHKTGDAIKALFRNGVDEKKRIIGTTGLTAVLYNVPAEFIRRFREQLTLIDCQFQDESVIRKAVWSCFQEKPVKFCGQSLCDPGAFPEPPLGGKLTWSVTQPWAEPGDDSERVAKQKALEMIETLKARCAAKAAEENKIKMD